MNPPKNLAELTALWDLKLKESGFQDAEQWHKGQRVLKQRSSNAYRQAKPLEREMRPAYFSALFNAVGRSKTLLPWERKFLTEVASGRFAKHVALELGVNRKRALKFLRDFEKKWGLRHG